MKFIPTQIPEVFIIEPRVIQDSRGYFFESYRNDLFQNNYAQINFVQDNESKSKYGVLRGLHYQLPPFAQSKLVRVILGTVLDVAVDIRKGSPTFGKYVSVELNDINKKQFFIPQGFAHGYVVLSDEAVFTYKVDNYYSKAYDRCIKYNDPLINVDWKIDDSNILLSEKDKNAPLLNESELFIYAK